jgi:myo-inositol-1(or 4)-monophosphatase
MIDSFTQAKNKALSEETRIALEAARRGGDVLLSYWQQLHSLQIREKMAGDLVTSADLASEKVVTDFLQREMPEAAIISEEGTETTGSGPVWYIDPLDGTTNFVQQFPVFAVSLGLAMSGNRSDPKILCGVVYNPVSGELFYAARDRGSYLRDRQIHVSTKISFGDAVIATGFPRRYHGELKQYLREFETLFPNCRAVRRAGAASLDLCWTAQGVFDGFWEHRLSPWDVAAGILIVEEAGGLCTDLEGGSNHLVTGDILGAPPAIHDVLLKHIRQANELSDGGK